MISHRRLVGQYYIVIIKLDNLNNSIQWILWKTDPIAFSKTDAIVLHLSAIDPNFFVGLVVVCVGPTNYPLRPISFVVVCAHLKGGCTLRRMKLVY